MLAVDRHQFVAQRVVRRMQRHGQRAVHLFGELVDLRHETGRGQRHAATRDIEAEVVHQHADGGDDIAEIGERLAHAHQHHVGDAALATRLETEFTVGEPDLADDLGGGEVAVEALLRRGAERAVEHAAHLRGDAERAAIGLGDEYRLEGLRGIGAQQPFAGAVRRGMRRDDLGHLDLGVQRELGAEVARQVAHRFKAALAALVEPAHELARAEGLAAQRRDERLQLGPREAEQVGSRVEGSLGHGWLSPAGRVPSRGRSTRFPWPPSPGRRNHGPCWPRCSARDRHGWCPGPPSWGRWRP